MNLVNFNKPLENPTPQDQYSVRTSSQKFSNSNDSSSTYGKDSLNDSQIDHPKENTNARGPQIFSVSQLNSKIRGTLESQFVLCWVKGEISNFKPHSSGHFYFSLKDSQSQIKAVMFKGYNSKLKFKPHDGLEVILRGRVTVYEPRGDYQVMCDMMEPVGAGALQKAFEQLKDKLKKEGLFESQRKKPLPPYPRHVAIITSPTGAAIQDILNILRRRARGLEITVVPTIVQGEASASALRDAFNKALLLPSIDVIIIGRGGGSIEDLWGFNDEGLARLIAASNIPTISAVGHEVDFTICDFVADLRAPTPSAAAELVIKSADELSHKIMALNRMITLSIDKSFKMSLQKWLGLQKRLVDPKRKMADFILKNDDLYNRLLLSSQRYFRHLKDQLEYKTQRIPSPQRWIDQKKTQINMASVRLQNANLKIFENKKNGLHRKMAVLDSLSPLRVVERGYSMVLGSSGELIKSVRQIKPSDTIDVRLTDGIATATIKEIKNISKGDNHGI